MSELQLHRPLCFFDLETTGINVGKDRIVEICILKTHPDGKEEVFTSLVNPEMQIPAEAAAVHGITDEKVKDAPTFRELAPRIAELLKNSDLGGFNSNHFDIPLLAEELLRAEQDLDLKKARTVDSKVIFFKQEPRNLSAAYKFYCDKDLEDAHSAEADTRATFEIFKAQIQRYEDLHSDMDFLHSYSNQTDAADFAGFIRYNENGNEVFSFGKYKGQKVEDVLQRDAGYYSWIQNADFPLYTKRVLTEIKLRSLNTKG
ncbi:MAG: 3'-5' exonuclease [Weeksellaceae bacterium]|nr:3'-5' exonuclease [Weeksellaceae bacterium]